MIDLSLSIAGISLQNPTVLASGIMGVSVASMRYVQESGAGAVTIKSIGPLERSGHANPTVFSWGEGVQNAVGLSNPGIDGSLEKITSAVEELRVPVFGSMFADTIDNFKRVGEKMATTGVAAIEVNLSCPNVSHEYGKMFAMDTKMTFDLIEAVKSVVGTIPVFAKLSADNPDIAEVGKSAEAAGADGIAATNTISGVIIDIHMKRPILTNKIGGLSGKAIKPMGVRAVWNLYKAVKIPIIGIGGIQTGEDAIEYIMAGATAVGIGSGVYTRGIDVFKKVTDEMTVFMQEQGYTNVAEMRGVAHK